MGVKRRRRSLYLQSTSFQQNGRQEDTALKVSQSLAGHKRLKWFMMFTSNDTASDITEAMHRLLASSNCQLEFLCIKHHSCGTLGEEFLGTKLNTDRLVEALENNSSLNQITITNHLSGPRPFSQLMSVLPSHPAFELLSAVHKGRYPGGSKIREPFTSSKDQQLQIWRGSQGCKL
mmetsp:Transcript_44335/g.106807  ORF Transcript_44335/g.106807 Transcript_44335/m.106807 type:complete len:176 (-) Transcript_44335:275-802(-)